MSYYYYSLTCFKEYSMKMKYEHLLIYRKYLKISTSTEMRDL